MRLPRSVALLACGGVFGAGAFAVMNSRSHESAPGLQAAFYANCREAIQDGVAPLHRGQPGYRPELDADDDGIACEPYRPR